MAKKFGKFLLFSAVAGAAVAGAYYYMKNKDASCAEDMDDDEDFDDFGEDLDEEAKEEEKTRSYVDLKLEKAQRSAAEAAGHLKDAAKEAAGEATDAVKEAAGETKDAVAEAAGEAKNAAKEAAGHMADTAEARVEEFFDDDDNSADSI